MTEIDFRNWLTEDLEDLADQLTKDRIRAETYSERAELNKSIGAIRRELELRKKNEWIFW